MIFEWVIVITLVVAWNGFLIWQMNKQNNLNK